MLIDRLARRIGALTNEPARRYGRITEYRYMHIFVFGAGPFGRLRISQRLGLVHEFPIAIRTHELVGQKRGDQVGIICLL